MTGPILLSDYTPLSMLRVQETHVPRARFPAIDFHTHLSWTYGSPGGEIELLARADELQPVMERCNVETLVNLTAGYAASLDKALDAFPPHDRRFLSFTEPIWSRVSEPDYPRRQADEIVRAHAAGARGVKILKVLGLNLKDGESLIRIDDPRFDPMWEAAGSLGMPVTIHSSDPEAFFRPIDACNERLEELHEHPDWCFCTAGMPASRELHEARDRVVRRHPGTAFVCAHVACAEDLGYVSQRMDEFPNMHVDISARIGELGRQPRTSRRFFERYQDRILFGTDAIPRGALNIPAQTFSDELYRIYFRFLETADEYFDYAPVPSPPQGRWRIYGIDLPDEILRKVYRGNAARLLGFSE